MANLRVIYDNAADRATLSSTATAASLSVANLKTNIKSAVCRSTTTSITLTCNWTSPETVGGIVLAFTNFSNSATITAKGYTNSNDTTEAVSVSVPACAGGISNARGVNSFASGGGVYARAWFPAKTSVKKLEITVSDPTNPQGYVEAGRLIVGDYWEPSFGVEQDGTTLSVVDTTSQVRTEAGDMHITVKPRFRKLSLSMPSIDKNDRGTMWSILWNNGNVLPVFVSVFPNHADAKLEQVYQLFGRLVQSPVMSTPYFNYHSTKLELEEI